MNIVLFRYSPRVVELKYLDPKNAIIVAPKSLKEKYDIYDGLEVKVVFLEEYTLPEIIKYIAQLKKDIDIESITTLSEEDMDWVGFLEDFFLGKKSTFVVNTLFKDKYYMRSVLEGCTDIPQPKFELVTTYENLSIFFEKYNLYKAIIKARNLAGSEEVYKVTKEELRNLPKRIYDGGYLIEEYVKLNRMLTCDGFAIGSDIQYIFSHEYEELLLNTLNEKSGYTIRTNHLYWTNLKLLKRIFKTSQKVLEIFTNTSQVTPFHFEWFYDEEKELFIFCEVGKRFGGGAITSLIEYGFENNILEKYWQAINRGSKYCKINSKLIMPKKIATSYSPYLHTGIIAEVPEKKFFDWTKETYFFVKPGDNVGSATAVVQNIFLSIFVSDSENEYQINLKKINKLAKNFKYEYTRG